MERSKPSSLYNPLRPGEIRLLNVHPGKDTLPVACELVIVSLNDNPEYEALSYVWGDAKSKIPTVQLSGELISVTLNLTLALMHLQDEKLHKLLWIDAVCINQDDINERGSQVQMMTKIYQNASCVLIWLGEADDESEEAFDLIEKWYKLSAYDLVEYYARKLGIAKDMLDIDHVKEMIASDSKGSSWPDLSRAITAIGKLFHGIDESEPWPWWRPLWTTFSRFGPRPWWKRRWVIQEFLCARQTKFVCGSRWIYCDALIKVTDSVSFLVASHPVQEKIQVLLSDAHLLDMLRKGWDIDKGAGNHISFTHAVNTFKDRQCSDLHDAIYAFLGIGGRDLEVLTPNYEKSVAEVFAEATKAIISHSQNLNSLFLTYVGSNADEVRVKERLPSWVRDFSPRRTTFRPISIASAFAPRDVYKATGGSRVGDYIQGDSNTLALTLRGMMHDRITKASTVPEDININRDIQGLKAIVRGWWSMSQTSLAYPAGGSNDEAYYHTLVTHLQRSTYDVLGSQDTAENLLHFSQNFRLWCNVQSSHGSDFTNLDDLWERNKAGETFEDCVLTGFPGYSFVITEKGYMGIVCGVAIEGDMVYLVEGSSVPLVLRRQLAFSDKTPSVTTVNEQECHKFVGAAYIFGIMDGEAWKDIENGVKTLQLICLV